MKKIIILIPVYNDWDSLSKLLIEVNEKIKFFSDFNFECLIVNDASTESFDNNQKQFSKINSVLTEDLSIALSILSLGIFADLAA